MYFKYTLSFIKKKHIEFDDDKNRKKIFVLMSLLLGTYTISKIIIYISL